MANDMVVKDGESELQEIQTSAVVENKLQEIQGAMILAKRFPRNYDHSWNQLTEFCRRKTIAQSANYSYPRGGKQVKGQTVKLARLAAQCYGNIRYGIDILEDEPDSMKIQGWAWDLETNNKVEYQDKFKKLIQRKRDGETQWIKPNERDLRELVFKRGAILVRNALFGVIPPDMIEDAAGVAIETLTKNIKDPKGEKKRLILAFQALNITPDMIDRYFNTEEWAAEHLVELQTILTTINDGMSKASDYFKPKPIEEAIGKLDLDEMESGDSIRHQGHELPEEK